MEIDQRILLLLEKVVDNLDQLNDSAVAANQKIALFAELMEECKLRFITYIEEKEDA